MSDFEDDRAFFLHAQGKDSLGGDDNVSRGRRCCKCWLVPFRWYTWKNLIFNLFVNPWQGCLGFAVSTAWITLSLATIPLCGLGLFIGVACLYLIRRLATCDFWTTVFFSSDLEGERRKVDDLEDLSFKEWAVGLVINKQTWKDVFYMWLFKFPLGLTTIIVAGVGVGVAIACIGAPVVYYTCDTCMKDGNLCIGEASSNSTDPDDWANGTCDGWKIDDPEDAFALTALGILALIIMLHISNFMAWCCYKFARCMLSDVDETNESLIDDPRRGKKKKESSLTQQVRQSQVERKYGLRASQESGGYGAKKSGGGGYLSGTYEDSPL